jgi:hypothetical protein
MASNDDLDSFFKKKDRKTNKTKKQTGLLTNNEELLKQLGEFAIDLLLIERNRASSHRDISDNGVQREHGFPR